MKINQGSPFQTNFFLGQKRIKTEKYLPCFLYLSTFIVETFFNAVIPARHMNGHAVKFVVTCKLGKRIRTTYGHWEKITTVKHPIVKGKEQEAEKTLADPNEIRVSKTDNEVYIYYRNFDNNFFVVVSKHLNGDGYIITSYITDSIKEGRLLWKK